MCVAVNCWPTFGSGASKQRPQCLQNRVSLRFSSAQPGHFLMATAFTHKSYLLHDHEQRKRIQREKGESFPFINYLQGNVPYALQVNLHPPCGRNALSFPDLPRCEPIKAHGNWRAIHGLSAQHKVSVGVQHTCTALRMQCR